MVQKKVKLLDMPPHEIRIALLRHHETLADIARICRVSKAAVSRTIYGKSSSHRIRIVIAAKVGLSIEKIWPSIYLYGKGPRKKGRPKNANIKE